MFRWMIAISLLCTAAAPVVLGCPNCKEAVAASGDPADGDPLREARAYNNSIYFMLAVPYSLLGVGTLVGYRMYRSQRRYRPEDV